MISRSLCRVIGGRRSELRGARLDKNEMDITIPSTLFTNAI